MKNISVQIVSSPSFDVPGMIGGLGALTQYKKEFKPTSHEAGLKLMKALYAMGHTSLFECADFGFIFGSTSRIFLAQITRHRISSFTSGSQQYQDHDNFPYVIPESIANDPSSLAIYESMMQSIDHAYGLLKENGISKDDARFLLPGGAANHLYAKFNLREIVGPLMTQRTCRRNTPEPRHNVQKMLQSMINAGFKDCIQFGGCACIIEGKCDQGKLTCGKPFKNWNEMVGI